MDPERHTCTWNGQPVTLTVTEFPDPAGAGPAPGVVKSRNALMDAAYDDPGLCRRPHHRQPHQAAAQKFKAVDDDFEMIETLYGVGYRFKVSLRPDRSEGLPPDAYERRAPPRQSPCPTDPAAEAPRAPAPAVARPACARFSSSLTRRIIVLNLGGLFALLLGFLYLNQFRAGLIDARLQSLQTQGEIIAAAIASSATVETDSIAIDPGACCARAGQSCGPSDQRRQPGFSINPDRIGPLLHRLVSPTRTQARVYDRDGNMLLDLRAR